MDRRRRLIRDISLMMGLTAAITFTSTDPAWAPNCGGACSVSRSARIPLHGTFFDANSNTTISLDGLVHVVSQALLTDTSMMLALHADIATADVKVTAATGSKSQALGAAMIQDVWCSPASSEPQNPLAFTIHPLSEAPRDRTLPLPFKIRFNLSFSCAGELRIGGER